MKILYKDLLNFLVEKPSKELLSEKLFQLGHEHEIDGDIFEMELTPNRGDCLSLIGLSRDLAVFLENLILLNYLMAILSLLKLILKIFRQKIALKFLF